VRDMLLGKTPQDYDITTNAKPDDIVKIFPKTVPVGAQFGVILVIVAGQSLKSLAFVTMVPIWMAVGRRKCATALWKKTSCAVILRSMEWSMTPS
jgi:hypothetical protein